MPEYRRGVAAVKATSSGGGGISFAPEIFWKDDGEKKYVLILTPTDEIWKFDLHEFIPVNRKRADGSTFTAKEAFMSRKDPYVGEDFDKIEDELGRAPRTRCLGVGVELEPVMEVVKGRKRPTGFSVKTREFTRNTEDGEQQVTVPLIGFITQSAKLMWGPLVSYDESQGPLSELPLEIIRRTPGKKSETRYDFVPFMDIPVDLSSIVDNLDGVTYLSDVLEDVIKELEATDGDDVASAQVVARALVEKRVTELADGERYTDLVGPIDELPSLPWESSTRKPVQAVESVTVQKKSQRETAKTEEPAEEESTTRSRFADLKARIESGS